jgi:hypothetical protein
VATDASGDVLVVGDFGGSLDFGGPAPLVATTGATNVFIAKLGGASGSYGWATSFSGSGNQRAASVAVDASGDVLVTGQFSGSVDFGAGPVAGGTSNNAFVAKLAAGSGALVWAKQFAAPGGTAAGSSVTVDAATGNVLAVGSFTGAVDFGCGALTAKGSSDMYVVALDTSGSCAWSKSFGGAGAETVTEGAAFAAGGNLLVTGTLSGTADFGGGPLTSESSSDVFVAVLSSTGSYVWANHFGAGPSGNATGMSIAADASGNILLTGSFQGSVDFGGGALDSVGTDDLFIAKLAPSSPPSSPPWTYVWSKSFGNPGGTLGQQGFGIAADSAGDALVTGAFSGTITFVGGSPLASMGMQDVFVAKLSP